MSAEPDSDDQVYITLYTMDQVLQDARRKLHAARLLGAPLRARIFSEDALFALVRHCMNRRNGVGECSLNLEWINMIG